MEIVLIVFFVLFYFSLLGFNIYQYYRFRKNMKVCKHYCPDCKNKNCQYFQCFKKRYSFLYEDKKEQ